ncbi:MAG: SPFH domain-containing protein [Phycisphaerales bacterium JB039]
MKGDFLSYRRATSHCVLGMLAQAVLGLGLLIYGIVGGDSLARAAAVYALPGVGVWLALLIVFDQHRRERIEAMEAESFASSDASSTSVFEQSEDDLRVAAKRLRSMHQWFLPAVSALYGLSLLVMEGLLLRRGLHFFSPRDHVMPDAPMLALTVGLAVAFVGFIVGRYFAGMAQRQVWQNLRGGATVLVGTGLMGLGIGLGHIVNLLGSDSLLRWMEFIIPGLGVALGIEVFLNLIMAIYRPRKPGEVPRPAFDSRVLSYIAAPDNLGRSIGEALDYQFGFELSSSWFYQLLSRLFVPLVVVGLLIMWFMTSFVVVQPHQTGMILRFGRIVRSEVSPGLHFKAPWPIDRLLVPAEMERTDDDRWRLKDRTTTGIREFHLGTPPAEEGKAILWTNEHITADEQYMLVQPSSAGASQQATSDGSGGMSLVAVEIPVQYVVRDVEAYERLGPPGIRDRILREQAARVASRYFLTKSMDDVLGPGRRAMDDELKARINEAYSRLNFRANGEPVVDVLFVGVNGAHPDRSVAPQFEQVIQAQQVYRKRLAEAQADAIAALSGVVGSVDRAERIAAMIDEVRRMERSGAEPAEIIEARLAIRREIEAAGGEASSAIAAASAKRWKKHMGSRALAQKHAAQAAAYDASPQYYRAERYLKAMAEAIKGARLFLTPGNQPDQSFVLEFQEQDTGRTFFEEDLGAELQGGG